MNPPYSQVLRVRKKYLEDKAHVVVVLPEWKARKWYREALELRFLDLRCPKGYISFSDLACESDQRCGR